MNLRDPFSAPERLVRLVEDVQEDATSPPDEASTAPPACGWLLPIPEDAERGTKAERCGEPAPFKIRIKDPVSYVEVDACPAHKAEHDEKAASLRQKAQKGQLTRRGQRRAG